MKRKLQILLMSILACGCSHGPEPIQYGEDQCAFCKMTIEDPKFGGEIITSKGRTYKFDALECLASALPEYNDVRIVMITPMDRVGTLTSVDSVSFLESNLIRSPMGAGLGAFLDKSNARGYPETSKWISWDELKTRSYRHE